jgi:hypothetical protein
MRTLAGLAAALTAAVFLAALGAAPALAHRSPAGCTSNSLDIALVRESEVVRNGDVNDYTVLLDNVGGAPCDVTGVTARVTLPAPDGTPTGESVLIASNADYPAGLSERAIAVVPWTVRLNAGVADAVTQVRLVGVLHDQDVDHALDITRTIGTTVTQPSATVTGSASPPSGDSPLTTTITYTVTNDSSTNAPLNPESGGLRGDEVCSSLTRTGGDSNGNNMLDVGERWTYSCTVTLTETGNTTSNVTAAFTNELDDRPVTIRPAETTISVNSPPAATSPPATTPPEATTTPPATTPTPGTPATTPRSQVLGKRLVSPRSRRARGDAACIAVPATLRIRARERTAVRVRVTEAGAPVANALVRVLGPGYARRKVTNANGVAIFQVRTRRGGRLVIQSDRCLGADRITVRGARRTSNNQTPQGTG